MNVNHTQLKKFAVRSRERLLSVTDDNTAYTSFMRLCAVDFVCPQFISKLADMNLNERHSVFAEKCHEYSKTYGGVFNNSVLDVECPEILLTDILNDISEIPL